MSLLRVLLLGRSAWPRLALAALAGAGALGAAVALTGVSAWLLSRAAQHPPVLTLMVAIVAVRALGLSRGVLRYVERLLSHDAAFRVLAGLRVRLYDRLERIAPAGLADHRSGDLLARLVDDVDSLQDVYLRVALPVAAGATVGLATGVVLGLLSAPIGVALMIGLLLAGVVVPWWASRTAERAEAAVAGTRAQLSVAVLDAVRGAADLLTNGADVRAVESLRRKDSELTSATRSSAVTAGWAAGASQLVTGATTLTCLVLGVVAVRSGSLDGVLLATCVLTPMAAFETVAAFPAAAQQVGRLRVAAGRVLDVLHREPPVQEPSSPVLAPTGHVHVRLSDVSVRWPGAGRVALQGISLDLPPGRRVAVVGPSGAGKSTLAATLLAFLRPESGRWTVDGVDVADLVGDDVRRLVGLCGQDAHVFDTTVEGNLRVARPEATEDELRDALRRARLLGWVDSVPAGLQTPVGEHGRRLSGGQRQRLSLARALLADRPVVVLDEPTEHVDESTADELTADLLEATRGRTTVLVTHRLTGLEDVDEVLVLVGGRIVQRGTHAELAAQGGWYADALAGAAADVGPRPTALTSG